MTEWSPAELRVIGDAVELEVTPARSDGGPTTSRPIWVVHVGSGIFVRSYRGPAGGWYRRVLKTRRGTIRAGGTEWPVTFDDADPSLRAEVDAAYRVKYSRYGAAYVGPMTSDDVAGTTLQVRPAD